MLKIAACVALALAVANAALENVPSFAVPSFDYESLQESDTSSRMLRALERDGIIALKNVPNYSNVRERFLTSAAQCAITSESSNEAMRYLSTKQFQDGTRRLTLQSTAGRELMDTDADSLKAMAANCPGHRELYEEFTGTLERAVDTFASALDQTEFKMGDGERVISARKLIGDAKRLDHFHAYEAASGGTTTRSLSAEESHRELSLGMHEDHGLFIAMAAPKFFSVDKQGSIRERRLKSDASGLVIGSIDQDQIVRPELKADELVIMIGSGASRWLETSHHLPAVMHGMQMPTEMIYDDEAIPGQRNLRTWFGKMTLMPSYQRLLASKMDFEEFTNRTKRHLMGEGEDDDLKVIGCNSGRRLHDSGTPCTFAICTLRPGTERPPTVGCHQACNLNTEFFDKKCANKCDCTGTTTKAETCWMLCVAQLPTDKCALEDQECLGLTMSCKANATDANATTEAPGTEETPLPTETPIIETPLPTETPIIETPLPTETPIIETPLPTETPIIETPLPTTVTPTEPPATTSSPSPSSTTVTTTPLPIETPEASVETQAPNPGTSTPTSEVPTGTPGSMPATNTPPSETFAPTIETPLPSVSETPTPNSATELPMTGEPQPEEPVVPGGHC